MVSNYKVMQPIVLHNVENERSVIGSIVLGVSKIFVKRQNNLKTIFRAYLISPLIFQEEEIISVIIRK